MEGRSKGGIANLDVCTLSYWILGVGWLERDASQHNEPSRLMNTESRFEAVCFLVRYYH
jgi:hypothetical protein